MIVTVTPTIQDGTVVRWYLSEHAAYAVEPLISASRNGVRIHGYLHKVPEAVLSQTKQLHEGWQVNRDAWPDVDRIATHKRRGILGPLEPIERAG